MNLRVHVVCSHCLRLGDCFSAKTVFRSYSILYRYFVDGGGEEFAKRLYASRFALPLALTYTIAMKPAQCEQSATLIE